MMLPQQQNRPGRRAALLILAAAVLMISRVARLGRFLDTPAKQTGMIALRH